MSPTQLIGSISAQYSSSCIPLGWLSIHFLARRKLFVSNFKIWIRLISKRWDSIGLVDFLPLCPCLKPTWCKFNLFSHVGPSSIVNTLSFLWWCYILLPLHWINISADLTRLWPHSTSFWSRRRNYIGIHHLLLQWIRLSCILWW